MSKSNSSGRTKGEKILIVSNLHFVDESEDQRDLITQAISPGLKITSINGKPPPLDRIANDEDFTVFFEDSYPLTVTFLEEIDMVDSSISLGIGYDEKNEHDSYTSQHSRHTLKEIGFKEDVDDHFASFQRGASTGQLSRVSTERSTIKDDDGFAARSTSELGSKGLSVPKKQGLIGDEFDRVNSESLILAASAADGSKAAGMTSRSNSSINDSELKRTSSKKNAIVTFADGDQASSLFSIATERAGNLMNSADSISRYVPDWRIGCSSFFDQKHLPKYCRLKHPTYCWSPSKNDQMTMNSWIRVDLTDIRIISKIRMQGSPQHSSWFVRSFWVDYSNDGCNWQSANMSHHMGGQEFVNKSNDCVHQLWPMISARFVRIRPYTFRGERVCLRFELYGYDKDTTQVHTFARLINQGDLAGQAEDRKILLESTVGMSSTAKVWQIDNVLLIKQVLEKIGMQNICFVPSVIPSNMKYAAGEDLHRIAYMCVFSSPDAETSESILDKLAESGIGKDIGIMSVSPVTFRKPEIDPYLEQIQLRALDGSSNDASKFVRTMKSRIIVQQVVERVINGATLSFDFIVMLITAGFIAAGGLATDSAVVVVASMLVSPLMGPVLAMTFGTTLDDPEMRRLGFRNEILCLAVCLMVGFVFGLPYVAALEHRNQVWPTEQMASRGKAQSLIDGVLIAVPSGVGVALAVLGDYMSTVVGVAISASLLPPAVNSGMLMAFALFNALVDGGKKAHKPSILLKRAGFSLALVIENIVLIYCVAQLMFYIKNVTLDKNSKDIWKGLNAYVENRHKNREAAKNAAAMSDSHQFLKSGTHRTVKRSSNKNNNYSMMASTYHSTRRPSSPIGGFTWGTEGTVHNALRKEINDTILSRKRSTPRYVVGGGVGAAASVAASSSEREGYKSKKHGMVYTTVEVVNEDEETTMMTSGDDFKGDSFPNQRQPSFHDLVNNQGEIQLADVMQSPVGARARADYEDSMASDKSVSDQSERAAMDDLFTSGGEDDGDGPIGSHSSEELIGKEE